MQIVIGKDVHVVCAAQGVVADDGVDRDPHHD